MVEEGALRIALPRRLSFSHAYEPESDNGHHVITFSCCSQIFPSLDSACNHVKYYHLSRS
jgi:hypothetical protein